MLPVYFPFTVLSSRLMRAFSTFFKRVVVYQVSERTIPERIGRWREAQKIEVRIPFQRYEREIAALLGEYQTWAQYHKGGDLSFFRANRNAIPYFSDTSTAQIRQDIKAKRDGQTAAGEAQLPHLYPQIFLQMAQNLDEHNREIALELESQAEREQDLMKDLKGEGILETSESPGQWMAAAEQTEYMIAERIDAWAHLMLSDNLESPLLITSQRRVLDDLVECMPRPLDVVPLQSIGVPGARQQGRLMEYLESLATLEYSGVAGLPTYTGDRETADQGARLSLYLVPGITPRELFGSMVKSDISGDLRERRQKMEYGNTVLGLVETD